MPPPPPHPLPSAHLALCYPGGIIHWSNPNSDAIPYGVRAIVRHPAYSDQTAANDIALVFLDECVELRRDLEPIALATDKGERWARPRACVVAARSMCSFFEIPAWACCALNPKLASAATNHLTAANHRSSPAALFQSWRLR